MDEDIKKIVSVTTLRRGRPKKGEPRGMVQEDYLKIGAGIAAMLDSQMDTRTIGRILGISHTRVGQISNLALGKVAVAILILNSPDDKELESIGTKVMIKSDPMV